MHSLRKMLKNSFHWQFNFYGRLSHTPKESNKLIERTIYTRTSNRYQYPPSGVLFNYTKCHNHLSFVVWHFMCWTLFTRVRNVIMFMNICIMTNSPFWRIQYIQIFCFGCCCWLTELFSTFKNEVISTETKYTNENNKL